MSKLPADVVARALVSGRKITPSFNDPWHGDPEPGSRWTRQQLARLTADGWNVSRVRTHMVPLLIENRIDWALPPQVTHSLCPLVAKSKDGRRVLVITPSGDKKWTDAAATGWMPSE